MGLCSGFFFDVYIICSLYLVACTFVPISKFRPLPSKNPRCVTGYIAQIYSFFHKKEHYYEIKLAETSCIVKIVLKVPRFDKISTCLPEARGYI